jgi:hypothetical protein
LAGRRLRKKVQLCNSLRSQAANFKRVDTDSTDLNGETARIRQRQKLWETATAKP